MDGKLRVLILEDRKSDAEFMVHELRRGGYAPDAVVVADRDGFVSHLSADLDVILADFNLPQFNALAALDELAAAGIAVPLIVVTGMLSDDGAVNCIRRGAADYLLKDRLARLPEAIARAIEQRRLRSDALRTHEALERNRERLEAIFGWIQDAILVVGDEGWIVNANPSAGRLTGYAPDELACRRLSDLFAAHGSPAHQMELGDTTAAQASFRCKDGRIRDAEYDLATEFSSGLHLVVFRDVTDRRRTEDALREAQKLESLAVLAGGVAHDLNNLLVAVLLNADLVLTEVADGAVVDPIEQVKAAAQQAAGLSRQLLAYAGRGSVRKEPFSVNAVVEEITQLLRASVAAGTVLQLDLAPGLPVIDADATQVRQVVLNLVVNAADAIGDQPGVITIASGTVNTAKLELSQMALPRLPDTGEFIYLEVSDTGCGMDAATSARIFDPFFSTKANGRGLGLAAARGIAQGHGGAPTVATEPGRGSTFRLLLPAIESRVARGEGQSAVPDSAWRASGRALVADDQVSVRIMIARALEVFGFSVDLVADGQAALDRFSLDPSLYTLVAFGAAMPRLSGEEALRQVRQLRPDIPALLISGRGVGQLTTDLADRKRIAMIEKPFDMDTLRAAVQSVTEGEL